jgi:hypothetical protein
MKKMPLLAFISFTSNFSAPFFFTKKQSSACAFRIDGFAGGV